MIKASPCQSSMCRRSPAATACRRPTRTANGASAATSRPKPPSRVPGQPRRVARQDALLPVIRDCGVGDQAQSAAGLAARAAEALPGSAGAGPARSSPGSPDPRASQIIRASSRRRPAWLRARHAGLASPHGALDRVIDDGEHGEQHRPDHARRPRPGHRRRGRVRHRHARCPCPTGATASASGQDERALLVLCMAGVPPGYR